MLKTPPVSVELGPKTKKRHRKESKPDEDAVSQRALKSDAVAERGEDKNEKQYSKVRPTSNAMVASSLGRDVAPEGAVAKKPHKKKAAVNDRNSGVVKVIDVRKSKRPRSSINELDEDEPAIGLGVDSSW
jgi:hypothetical protein